MSDLKPCPLCGSEDITIESFGEQRITACCSTCECNTGYMRDNLEAIESWNTRPIEDALQAKLDVAISTLLYYRANGKTLAEKALAKIEKIGGMNE